MNNALEQITTRYGWSGSFARPLELVPLTGRL